MTIAKCKFCGKPNPTMYHVNACELKQVKQKLAEKEGEKTPPTQDPPKTKDPVRVKKKETEPVDDDKVICDNCEKPISGQPKFCANCGVELAW